MPIQYQPSEEEGRASEGITPEMIEAGGEVLLFYDAETGDAKEMAAKVYAAMEAARGS